MTKSSANRFADLSQILDAPAEEQAREVGGATVVQRRTNATPAVERAEPQLIPEPEQRRGPGRAGGGKRSRVGDTGDMIQTSIYLTKDTHRRTKAALILDGSSEDLSELIERMLVGWLDEQKQ